MSCWKK